MKKAEKNYIHNMDKEDYQSELLIGISPYYGLKAKDLLTKNALLITKERVVNPVLLFDGDKEDTVCLMLQPKSVMTVDASSSSYFIMAMIGTLRRIISKEKQVLETSITDEECLERMKLENDNLSGINNEPSFCSVNVNEEYIKGGRMKVVVDKMIEVEEVKDSVENTLQKLADIESRGKEVGVSQDTKDKIDLAVSSLEDFNSEKKELMDNLDLKIDSFMKLKELCDKAEEEFCELNGSEVFKKEDISISQIRKIFEEKGPMAVQEELERLTPERREEILKQLL